MKLHIYVNATIQQVQQEFNSIYPYLKIEFFGKPHAKGQATAGKYLINNTRTLGEMSSMKHEGVVELTRDMTVHQLEKKFEMDYGLYAQVFRKSGRIWLETTATDDWTLFSQNEEGRELSENSHDKGEVQDYHEQE